tara:strand:+ start:773 stop:2947 length:2175 start_codon:yes stop_codon:yes gene_type:complete
MPYNKELKSSNVNYIGRDFNDLKTSLIKYTKTYFPNTYQDFNETSPGMMLLELSAYVGDVLNFYIDNQYKEMLLPLSEERRNIITLAKSQGYKVKPTTPSYVILTVKQDVGALSDGKPDYAAAYTINKGMQVSSISNPDVTFETLEVVDFKLSGSAEIEPIVSGQDAVGLPTTYTLSRKVKSVSGKTTTHQFAIETPSKFKKLTLPENNVIEILKVSDSNGNLWHEVKTLAQDRVPVEKHYTSDDNRTTSYTTTDGNVVKLPVPYSLEYIKTSKRFVVDVDETNKTHLIFGNGILKNGQSFSSQFLAVEQIGINIPGGEEDLNSEIDPLLGDAYGTLGEAPAYVTVTVEYRIGGGINSNVSMNDLTNIVSAAALPSGNVTGILVTNNTAAAGGSSGETIEEIRQRSMGYASTQGRCVTKEDFEARTLALPARFGNIAKVYASRSGAVRNAQRQKLQDLVDRLKEIINKNYQMFDHGIDVAGRAALLNDIKRLLDANKDGGLNPDDFLQLYEVLEMAYANVTQDDRLYTIDLYLLSYDNSKTLINTPNIVKQNLKSYLNEHRMLTDQITIFDGYVVNFGIIFDIVALSYANKEDVRLRCIEATKKYFVIDTMQFKQILYTNEVENLLMDVDGVKAVNYVTLTQDIDYNAEGSGNTKVFTPALYNTLINSDGTTSTGTNTSYGYYYNFGEFYGLEPVAGRGVVLPAYEPAVFELKNPNKNIKGIVR